MIPRTKPIELAMITGLECSIMPYIIHRKTPRQKATNMMREISFVDFVFQIFMTFGTKAIVVIAPAK
jgi:Ca2+/Na+ antiporter